MQKRPCRFNFLYFPVQWLKKQTHFQIKIGCFPTQWHNVIGKGHYQVDLKMQQITAKTICEWDQAETSPSEECSHSSMNWHVAVVQRCLHDVLGSVLWTDG